jgi:SAM-dependent methyltransferase
MSFKDHFSTQASGYARSRPTYPQQLFEALASLAPGRALAWDAGSGNGQAAVALAASFEAVVATEPSAAQLAEATPHPRVRYHQAAEKAPMLADGSVDLFTAAQAAHWFDRPAYYEEVRRVARPGAIVALWTYALAAITPEIDEVVFHFYDQVVGPYWPPERVHCMTGYRDFDFPFAELTFPVSAMELSWSLTALVDYLATWSAVARYRQERGRDPIRDVRATLLPLWGEPEQERRVVWPLAGRLGRVQ